MFEEIFLKFIHISGWMTDNQRGKSKRYKQQGKISSSEQRLHVKLKYCKALTCLLLSTFNCSAILADIDVKFYPYVKDPIQRLKNSIFHGQLNGMAMDDNFLKVFNKTGKKYTYNTNNT